jgi:hypothetical protein
MAITEKRVSRCTKLEENKQICFFLANIPSSCEQKGLGEHWVPLLSGLTLQSNAKIMHGTGE